MAVPSARRRHPRSGPSIDHLLEALLADGLSYRCQPEPFRWKGQCPRCRRWTLRLAIENDEDLDDDDYMATGTVVLGCIDRCATPSQIRRYLGRRHSVIEYERLLRDLKAELAAARAHISRPPGAL